MNFAAPVWLYLLIFAVPLWIVVLVITYKRYKLAITTVFTIKQVERIISPGTLKIQKILLLVNLLILILLFLALSGPQWGLKPQEVKTRGVDLILAIDVSKSMLTEDVIPNRLEFAKRTAEFLLNRVDTHRVGIITFAEIAFYHCPFTIDIQAAKDFLRIIDTDIIPYQGTKMGAAIEEALRVFREHRSESKVLVFFTDGEDHGSYPKELAQQAKKEGVIIYTVGVGTPEGKPIPIRDQSGRIVDYKKDKQGQIVVSKLNEQLLYEIAEITGGRYFSLAYGEAGIAEQIVNEIGRLKSSELKTKVYNIYTNRYYYFVYLVLLLLMAEIFIPKTWLVKL